MASKDTDPKKNSDNSDKVVVDPYALQKQVNIFDSWGRHILTQSAALNGLTIGPGAFPAANRYRNIANERIKNLWSNSTNIGNVLISIGKNLTEIADSYLKANDRNADEAARAGKLANDVSVNAPGANVAIPTTFGVQPPPPPQPAPVPNGGSSGTQSKP